MMDTQYLKKIIIRVASGILAVVILAYLLYHFFSDFNSNIETLEARTYSQQEIVTLNGYIFRNEQVLYSQNVGDIDILNNDGEKIKKGTAVANVYTGEEGSTLRMQLIDIDKKISLYRSSNVDIDAPASDTANIDKQIRQLYYVICSRIESGDIEYALQKQDELLTLLNRRQVITDSVRSFDDKIQFYEGKRTALTADFGDISESVFAPRSGYYYSEIDGYENTFSSSVLDTMKLEDFYEMVDSEPDTELTSDPKIVGKLVTDYRWYVACEIDYDDVRKFSTGKKYDVVFPYSEDTVIAMTLYRIVTEVNGDKAVLIFQSGVMPEKFNYMRMQEINLVINSYTGYKLPVEAIRVVNGEVGVYVLNGNIVKFKKVNILIEVAGYVITEKNSILNEDFASKLSEYDRIIIKGKDLYDGKIIN